MKVGLCTIAYKDKPLEFTLDVAMEMGFDGVEIWGNEAHLGLSAISKQVKKVREKVESRGLEISAYGSYARVLQEDFKQVGETCLKIAQELGAPLLRIWSGGPPSKQAKEEEYTQAIQQLKSFLPKAKDSGITIALECHGNGLTASNKGILRIIQGVASESLKSYYQPYNWKGADDPYELAASVSSFVACVHAQNFTPDYKGTFIDSGLVNYKKVLSILKNAGFNEYIEIEFLAGHGRRKDLKRDYTALRRLTKDLRDR